MVFSMACFCISIGHHTRCLLWWVEPGIIAVLLHELPRLICLLFHSAVKIIKDVARFIQHARLKWLWSQLLFVLRGHCVLLHFSTEDMKAPFDVQGIFFCAHCTTISSIFWKHQWLVSNKANLIYKNINRKAVRKCTLLLLSCWNKGSWFSKS